MPPSSPLSRQKRRLSVLFSLSIFSIIVLLDIAFLSYKYFDYRQQEFGRLSFQSQNIAKMLADNPGFIQDLSEGKWIPLPPGVRRGGMQNRTWWRVWDRRGIPSDNFFLYRKPDGTILFAPRKDDELYKNILKEVRSKEMQGKDSFELNEAEYFFLDTPVGGDTNGVFFAESRMTADTIILDALIYLMGAILLSLGVYAISSRFVDHTLTPVEKSMDDMEQFIHNAGHELKTPLSVVKSSLELMRLSKNYDEGITESIAELDRMNGLIQALISLSTADNARDLESVDIREIFETLRKNYQEKLDEKNLSFQISGPKTLTIQTNREYAEMLFGNLVSNAIKYNRENGNITVTIDQKNVTIRDTGIGIAQENINKVFDRFYQEGESRMKDSFGIGLSLVKRIADIYHWKIAVESEKWKGTSVIVRF